METNLATRPSLSPTSKPGVLARRPRLVLAALMLFLAIAGVLGGGVAAKLGNDGFQGTTTESARAVERIAEASGINPGENLMLLVTGSDGAPPTDAVIRTAARDLDEVPGVGRVIAPNPQAPGLRSTDGASALVIGNVDADAAPQEVAEAVLARFEGRSDVAVGGGAVMSVQLGDQVGADLGRAELFALPFLAGLCLLVFGRRGVWLPLLVGAATVLGSFLAISVVNSAYSLSVFALNLVMGLGLGLAIDYSLFLLSRFRDELAAGAEPQAAIRSTMRTTGRTVAFSAATVASALITLTVFPQGFAKSMGIAGAIVALMAAVASLVITPAILAIFGTKLARRHRAGADNAGGWYRLSRAVMRRPGVVALATTALMMAVAAPALRTVWTPVDGTVVPTSLSARTVSDAISADFPGGDASSITLAIKSSDAAAVEGYAAQVASLPDVATASGPLRPHEIGAGTWQIDVPVAGAPVSETAQELVREIRGIPGSLDVLVGGQAAAFVDQQADLGGAMPTALALLAALTFIVLWLMTGSIVLPLKAIVMNALTVGSALSIITLIYQDGRLTSLLGYTSNGGIEPTDFIVSAAVVFALSTDYGVFLLGRIKEMRDAGLSERESVAVGVQRTGHVVTAAALLLAVAIGAFSTSSISFIQQIGIAVAFGVLIDAFVVRGLLVPSLMGLLGRWNWWSPMWLRRLHDRVGISEHDSGSAATYSHRTMTAPAVPSTVNV